MKIETERRLTKKLKDSIYANMCTLKHTACSCSCFKISGGTGDGTGDGSGVGSGVGSPSALINRLPVSGSSVNGPDGLNGSILSSENTNLIFLAPRKRILSWNKPKFKSEFKKDK